MACSSAKFTFYSPFIIIFLSLHTLHIAGSPGDNRGGGACLEMRESIYLILPHKNQHYHHHNQIYTEVCPTSTRRILFLKTLPWCNRKLKLINPT